MTKIENMIESYIGNRKLMVDILAVLFGMGSWIGINGIFVQLPLLVKSAPEEWNLPSFMSVAVQFANFGPIAYALYRKFCSQRLKEEHWICFLLLLGAISSLLMGFFYDHVSYIGGNPHSTVFLILVFFTALVGCTSSVLFYPFMGYYKEMYLISYFIGEGLSGFLPSILALVQGIGGHPECIEKVLPDGNSTLEAIYKDPRYSTQIFFFIISTFSIVSFTSFLCLIKLNVCNNERVPILDRGVHKMESTKKDMETDFDKYSDVTSNTSFTENNMITRIKSTNLLLLMSIICAFGNGIFPSIQSFSCLPYGNTAYHLSVTLGSIANPIACFLAIFLPKTSYKAISILTTICAVFISYTLATSVMSPMPPLVNTTEGIVIVVSVWILAIGLVSYIKLCISMVFRTQGGSWMFYCGVASQIGSASGSLLSFFLINYTDIFVPSDPCQ